MSDTWMLLSQVQDPTPAVRDLDALTTHASTKDGRTVRASNPLSRNERVLFEVHLSGEHALHGFTNRDVRQKLRLTAYPLAPNEDMHSGQVTRLFRRLHAQGPHRQNPSFATLLGFPRRSKDHDPRDQTPGGRLPESRFRSVAFR